MKARVLVVDDDEALAEMIGIVLRNDDFEPVFVHDGAQALDMFRTVKPDLVLLDIHLPDISGLTNLDYAHLRNLRRSTGLYSHWDDHEFINDFSVPEHGAGIYRRGVTAFTDYAPVTYSRANGLYRTFRWHVGILVPTLVTTVLVGGTLAMWFAANFDDVLTSLDKDPSLTGRMPMWQAIGEAIQARLWLGYGYGAFWLGGSPSGDLPLGPSSCSSRSAHPSETGADT